MNLQVDQVQQMIAEKIYREHSREFRGDSRELECVRRRTESYKVKTDGNLGKAGAGRRPFDDGLLG